MRIQNALDIINSRPRRKMKEEGTIIQTIFPKEDMLLLKARTDTQSYKAAIRKAIYFYLRK